MIPAGVHKTTTPVRGDTVRESRSWLLELRALRPGQEQQLPELVPCIPGAQAWGSILGRVTARLLLCPKMFSGGQVEQGDTHPVSSFSSGSLLHT